jgi:hypothetical protein
MANTTGGTLAYLTSPKAKKKSNEYLSELQRGEITQEEYDSKLKQLRDSYELSAEERNSTGSVQEYVKKKDSPVGRVEQGTGPLAEVPFPDDTGYYGPGFIDPSAFGADVPVKEEPSEEGEYSIAAVDADKSYDINKDRIDKMLVDLANMKASPVDMSKYETMLEEAKLS